MRYVSDELPPSSYVSNELPASSRTFYLPDEDLAELDKSGSFAFERGERTRGEWIAAGEQQTEGEASFAMVRQPLRNPPPLLGDSRSVLLLSKFQSNIFLIL